MGWMDFAASLVRSLAWPAAVVVVVVILREPLAAALRRGVRRLRAGPVEVEFDQELAEVRHEIEASPDLSGTKAEQMGAALAGGLREELELLARSAPRVTVMEAFARVEARLRELVEPLEPEVGHRGAVSLARSAQRHGLISAEILKAIEGIAVLRNLAAHGRVDDITVERAIEYTALADAVLFALRDRPQPAGS